MNKIVLFLITIIFFSGCNSKIRAFHKGKTLVCIKHNFFSKDKIAYINNSNAEINVQTKTHFQEGFWKDGDFYALDDCAIQDN